jgi:hypothetical protein
MKQQRVYEWVRRAALREGYMIRKATHVAQNSISNHIAVEDLE